VVDPDVVRVRYDTSRQALPSAEIYYAVKANPPAEIVSALAALGANFDLASRGKFDTRKSQHEVERWVYLDAGLYDGLDETLNERIHYRIRSPHDGGPCAPVILAGPTCSSADILYRRHPYELPADLAMGDPIDYLSAGAYTTSVAAVAFNGFHRSAVISSDSLPAELVSIAVAGAISLRSGRRKQSIVKFSQPTPGRERRVRPPETRRC
jgi:diaminopimelate decarboxylase